MATPAFSFVLLLACAALPTPATPKSTIEPCSSSDTCNAMVAYTLYNDLKVSEVASLFQVDPVAVLTANAIDASYPDVENHILPSGLFLRVPVACSCADGIRKSVRTRYRTRPSDTLSSIAETVYSGLVSADQIGEANGIADPSVVVDAGLTLLVPLPCTCFNLSDNNLPTVYMSYVVKAEDTVAGIAAEYATTVTDILNVNAMGSPSVKPGDILAVPLPACASSFPRYATDYGLIVPNGSYASTASHCVQCSCGPADTNMHCTPASLAVSCSSMQCRNSNLMVGNVTIQQTSAGCNVTSCNYAGFFNGTILTKLMTSLQPRWPRQSPAIMQPPTAVAHESLLGPSPAPAPVQHGGVGMAVPRSSVPSTITLPNLSPTSGPAGSVTAAPSGAPTLVRPLPRCFWMMALFLCLNFWL